jgi:hypothetical protein
MKYLTIKNIYNRLEAEGPTFFKRLKIWAGACSVLGAGLIAIQSQYPEQTEFLPSQIGGYLLTAGLVGVFVASLTVSDPDSNPKVK